MFKWTLDRSLAFFDIEATGINPRTDRIVELAIVTISQDATPAVKSWRINPQVPIPPETTKLHGIRDEDVAECPTFKTLSADILNHFANSDLAGYNLLRFDIPMLVEEFHRAGIEFDLSERRIIDVQRIFHKREPRDLAAALAFYCGEMHIGAHSAESDALATLRALEGQFFRYPDLPRSIADLHDYCNPREPDWVDRTGRLKWTDNEIVLNFGKRKGESLRKIVATDPSFVKWILRSDFPRDMQKIVLEATEGRWPSR